MKYAFFLFFLVSCSSHQENTLIENPIITSNIWSVDEIDIKGRGKTYELSSDIKLGEVTDFLKLSDHEKVALVSFKNEVRVYPYYFTNHFEVINDFFDNKNIAISYCPLTKSGICFNRTVDNKTYEFLASGYLYKDNMVPSDKDQKFYWSQMLMTVIGGDKIDKTIQNFNLIETNWKTVKDFFPEAKVYYNEKRAVNATDPIEIPNLNSQYIHGIINDKVNTQIDLYPYEIFGSGLKIIEKIHNNKPTIIIGSEGKQFVTSFFTKDNLVFSLLNNSKFPNILKDNEGNIWNIFGYAISGARKGEQLQSPKSYASQVWAWKSLYENLKFN